MRGFRFLLFLVILSGATQPGFGQWASVRFAYGPPSPPITDIHGQPAPMETFIRVMHDLGTSGPSPDDTVISALDFRGPVPQGYFLDLYGVGIPPGINVYLAISLPGICWYTADYEVVSGPQGILFAEYQMMSRNEPCAWGNELPIAVNFRYCVNWSYPMLGCPCDDAVPFVDGTMTCYFHDIDMNGPDGGDTLLYCVPSHWDPEDTTCFDPDVSFVRNHPDGDMQVFLRVYGDDCYWTTMSFVVQPGEPDVWISGSDWTCTMQTEALFCYADDGQGEPEPPLTDGTGVPIQDGVPISLIYDIGDPGPDPSDWVLTQFPFNGEAEGFGSGYFVAEPVHVDSGSIVYLAIGLADQCWYTFGYQIPPIPDACTTFEEWTSTTPPCPWDSASAAAAKPRVPLEFLITSAYPNPFNSSTRIEFNLTAPARVEAVIFNLNGQRIRTLTDQNYFAGSHALIWDAGSAGSGLYLCRIRANAEVRTHKLLLLR